MSTGRSFLGSLRGCQKAMMKALPEWFRREKEKQRELDIQIREEVKKELDDLLAGRVGVRHALPPPPAAPAPVIKPKRTPLAYKDEGL